MNPPQHATMNILELFEQKFSCFGQAAMNGYQIGWDLSMEFLCSRPITLISIVLKKYDRMFFIATFK